MASTIWNQSINAGEEWMASIILKTPAGAVRDLRGAVIASQIKRHYKSVSYKEILGITVNDATGGQISLKLTNAQTSNLKSGKYIYDVEVRWAPTLLMTNATAAFTLNETITGGTSGATGKVLTNATLTDMSYEALTGTFVANEVITGGESGTTAEIVQRKPGELERVIEGSIEIRPEVTT